MSGADEAFVTVYVELTLSDELFLLVTSAYITVEFLYCFVQTVLSFVVINEPPFILYL